MKCLSSWACGSWRVPFHWKQKIRRKSEARPCCTTAREIASRATTRCTCSSSTEARGRKYDEARTVEPGTQPVAVESPFGRLALSVCYDVRFPELYRALGEFDLMFVPSAFTVPTGAAHWETLLRARAIENLAYVVAPAQGGRHASGRETYGNTMIVDPWGEVLGVRVHGEGVVLAEIDLALIKKVRASLPALSNRRMR
jgi:predicted amidohydrolase